jgi:hypothetical protein
VRERAAPDFKPVGSRRPQFSRGIAPPPIRMAFNPLPVHPQKGRGGRGRGGAVRSQQPQGPPLPNPGGMPGLLQPPGPMDPMQRLALMMAVMVLGMPQVHSCHTTTGHEMSWGGSMSEPMVCPLITTADGNGISSKEERQDPDHWKRLPAVHCVATQSAISFMCGLDGRTRMVKYEKFQQPCGIQQAACWKALENGRLEIGKMEYPATMNQTRSHMAGEEGCSGSCRRQTRVLERKNTQVLMEVLVEKGWIWWNTEKGRAAIESGKVTTVLRNGEAVLENGLWVWKPGDNGPILARVGGANH